MPAKLFGYEKIFAGNSLEWGGSAVSSLWKTEKMRSIAYGCVLELTDQELAIYEKSEGKTVYREIVSVRVALEPSINIMDDQALETMEAFTFIKID